MIQRIQTVYYTLALALLASMFYVPVFHLLGNEGGIGLVNLLHFYPSDGYIYIDLTVCILAALSIFFHLECIFLFKNRKKQMQHTVVNMIFQIVATVLIGIEYLMLLPSGKILLGYGAIFPLIAIVLTWMAYKAVKKDDDLVKSLDRIR